MKPDNKKKLGIDKTFQEVTKLIVTDLSAKTFKMVLSNKSPLYPPQKRAPNIPNGFKELKGLDIKKYDTVTATWNHTGERYITVMLLNKEIKNASGQILPMRKERSLTKHDKSFELDTTVDGVKYNEVVFELDNLESNKLDKSEMTFEFTVSFTPPKNK